ncbi:MAG: translocase, partial [Brachybacterium sp.]|nr:translocase [Brachybacterium sp.]
QYDPRRIIREAWGDTTLDDLVPDAKSMAPAAAAGAAAGTAKRSSSSSSGSKRAKKDDGPKRAPFDDEAT